MSHRGCLVERKPDKKWQSPATSTRCCTKRLMSAMMTNKTPCTLRRSFVWKPDQCPHCGYALCDHTSGTHGVNDAVFRCSQSAKFPYGAILECEGPTFVRI